MSINLTVLPELYTIANFDPTKPLPDSVYRSGVYIIAKSSFELSVICDQRYITGTINADSDWKLLRYKGSIEAGESGVVAAVVRPLADAGISVIVSTTFDAGYFGVKASKLNEATITLKSSGLFVYAV